MITRKWDAGYQEFLDILATLLLKTEIADYPQYIVQNCPQAMFWLLV